MRYNAASLSTLNLTSANPPGSTAGIYYSDIVMWSILTHLPALSHFNPQCKVHRSALVWLTANSTLGLLKTIDLNLHSECMSRSPSVLIRFLCSLSTLESLALAGEIHPARSGEWALSHASTLKRLQLKTVKRSDSVFNLVALRAMTPTPLPLLEHLSITIKRSEGDSNEVSMYKVLGTMPRLQSVILGLDCSDFLV